MACAAWRWWALSPASYRLCPMHTKWHHEKINVRCIAFGAATIKLRDRQSRLPLFSSHLLCRNSITHGLSTAPTTARSATCKRWLSINSSSLGRSCTCKSPRTSGCTTGAAARNNNGVISASAKVVTGEDLNFRVSVDAYRVSLTLHRSRRRRCIGPSAARTRQQLLARSPCPSLGENEVHICVHYCSDSVQTVGGVPRALAESKTEVSNFSVYLLIFRFFLCLLFCQDGINARL